MIQVMKRWLLGTKATPVGTENISAVTKGAFVGANGAPTGTKAISTRIEIASQQTTRTSMTWRRLTQMLAASVLLFDPVAKGDDLRLVGFDNNRGGAFSIVSGLPAVRPSIVSGFPGVRIRGVDVLTSLDRLQDDVVFVSSALGCCAAISPLSTAEQLALFAFVQDGGGAVIFAENDSFAGGTSDLASESIINAFGLEIMGTGPGGAQPAVVPNPSSSAVTSGRFGVINGFTIGWTGWFDNLGPYAIPVGFAANNNQPVLAYIPCGAISPGSGPVVLISDSTIISTDITMPITNINLIRNAIEYARSFSVASNPRNQVACPSSNTAFSLVAAGTGPFTYQWRKGGLPIDASAGANPSAATATLTLMNVQLSDADVYDCIVTNSCGSVTSNPATLNICLGDFNCDGGIDGSDIEAFFTEWEAGNAAADINEDGGIDGSDVEVFFGRWEAGC